jgi:hypothetical protein
MALPGRLHWTLLIVKLFPADCTFVDPPPSLTTT